MLNRYQILKMDSASWIRDDETWNISRRLREIKQTRATASSVQSNISSKSGSIVRRWRGLIRALYFIWLIVRSHRIALLATCSSSGNKPVGSFSNSQFWPINSYSLHIENRPGIRKSITSFCSLKMPFSHARLRRLEEMHEYRFFCRSSKQITPCVNAFSEVRRTMVVGVFHGCKGWVRIYKKNSDNILSPQCITAVGLFHVIFYPFSHKTHH